MRAAILLEGADELEIVDDVEIDEPDAGEVLVRVVACGLCHSDVSLIRGVHPSMRPLIVGHEAAGVVERVGAGVASLTVGDHVVLSPNAACGHCYWCVRNEHSSCANSSAIAFAVQPDGRTRLRRAGETVFRGLNVAALAEHALVGESAAIRIEPDLPLDVACIIGCAVQTGVGSALNTGGVGPGDSVLVLGAGGIGLSIVAGARIAGATRIIVSDPLEARREWATRFGATDVIDPSSSDVAVAARSLTGVGVDVAFDAVGHSALVEAAMDATRNGGTTVMVGAPPIDHVAHVNVVAAMFAEKKLVGSLLGGCHAARDIPRIVGFWQHGLLDLEALVTARRPLDEVNEAVADLEAGRGVRTVLTIA